MSFKNVLLAHVLVEIHTTSRLFCLWFTMVLTLRLITVRGGVSFGAVMSDSEHGLMSLGSETVTSNLHHETWNATS